jgi:hypothetical protein
MVAFLLTLLVQSLLIPTTATAAFSSAAAGNNPDVVVVRSYSLRDSGGRRIATMQEVRPAPRDAPWTGEDEVESLYPTTRRAFVIPGDGAGPAGGAVANVRQTSFGCGRLGATVWPSSIALAALLSERADRGDGVGGGPAPVVGGRRVLELGSGCGLPSAAASILGASRVLATDHWEEEGGGGDDRGRLMPKNPHGANLAHNVATLNRRRRPGGDGVGGGGEDFKDDPPVASVRRLDWHDASGARDVAGGYRPDLVIGSDLVYYPADVSPLLRTLGILLGEATDREGGGGIGGGERRREALLVSPLPPSAERESLGEFRERLEAAADNRDVDDGWLAGCDVAMDELVMVERRGGDVDDDNDDDDGEEERHNLLRIRIVQRPY